MELSIHIGNKIKEFRQRNNYTQSYLAELLGTTRQSISRYENGERKANQDLLFELADIFNVKVNDFFPEKETEQKDISTIYNELNNPRRKKVYNYAKQELDEQNNIIDINDYKDVYLLSKVSAGTGILDLDPQHGENVRYNGRIPRHYDVSFQVSGDSMEPTFEDGEIIFVEYFPEAINGALMVVQIDEQAYIKKVYVEEKHLRLVSLNQDYEDILASDGNQIRIIGKVVF